MENWSWGGMDDLEHGIYMDENNRRMVTNVRLQMANLADALIDVNDPQRALEVLNKLLRVTPQENVPYTRVLMPVVEAYAELASSDTLLSPNARSLSDEQRKSSLDKAQELLQALFKQQEELVEFALSLDAEYFSAMTSEIDLAIQVNDRLIRVYKYYHPEDPIVDELDARLGVMEDQIEDYERSIVELGFMEF
jgi:predicted Zn-dependent protease